MQNVNKFYIILEYKCYRKTGLGKNNQEYLGAPLKFLNKWLPLFKGQHLCREVKHIFERVALDVRLRTH